MFSTDRTLNDPLVAFRDRFGVSRALIGMLHVGALPGTPSASEPIAALIDRTVSEARVYQDAGFTGLASRTCTTGRT